MQLRLRYAQRSSRPPIDYMLVDAEGRASPVEGGDNDTYLGFCRQGPAGPCEMHEPETRRGETPMRDQLVRFPG